MRPRPAILVLAIARKNLQTVTSGLSAKQSLLKYRDTLRGRVGEVKPAFYEVKPALLYVLKGIYKELFCEEAGAIMSE